MTKGSGYYLALLVLARSLCLSEQGGNPRAVQDLRRTWKYSCEMPLMEPVADCTAQINKYFFNDTANMCQKFYWNGCLTRGVYQTRFECALSCNVGEQAAFCGLPPPTACTKGSSSKNRGHAYELDAYYYHTQSRACKSFKYCGRPLGPDSNFFTSLTMCIMECEGFPFGE